MSLTPKELDSAKQELDILFRARKNEIRGLESSIKVLETKKRACEKGLIEVETDFCHRKKELKDVTTKVQGAKLEARETKEEADKVLTIARKKEVVLTELAITHSMELALLDKDKVIIQQAKNSRRENEVKSRELDEQLKKCDERGKELNKLIEKQKDVDSIKASLEANKSELDSVIKENERKATVLAEQVAKSERDRQSLKIEIRKYAKSADANDTATALLKKKIELKEVEIEDIKKEKDAVKTSNDKVISSLEVRRRLVDTKEKRLDTVIDKIKKDKKYEDDLKVVGL